VSENVIHAQFISHNATEYQLHIIAANMSSKIWWMWSWL